MSPAGSPIFLRRGGALPLALVTVACSALFAGCSRTEAAESLEQAPMAPEHEYGVLSNVDALPSWNEGPAKKAIRTFVARVTTPGAPSFVPESQRIAAFDNDGTLWSEQPIYPQVAFTFDRVAELVARRPGLRRRQPFEALLDRDWRGVAASGEAGRMQLLAAAYAGTTTSEFDDLVTRWIDSARNPRWDRLYTELTYQPMLELISYLRAHDFKVFIVSGGGVEFMRPWTERVYGIPPEQVVGSRIKVQYDDRKKPALRRLPAVDLVDEHAGKPAGIQQLVGRRPLAAFGNSDGDFEMLEWTTSGPGVRLGMIVHHTDAAREWSYDRTSQVGKLSRALDEAAERGWVVVDMRRDWRVVYPFEL